MMHAAMPHFSKLIFLKDELQSEEGMLDHSNMYGIRYDLNVEFQLPNLRESFYDKLIPAF